MGLIWNRKEADPKSQDEVKVTTTDVQMSTVFLLTWFLCRVLIDFDGELLHLPYEQTEIVKAEVICSRSSGKLMTNLWDSQELQLPSLEPVPTVSFGLPGAL